MSKFAKPALVGSTILAMGMAPPTLAPATASAAATRACVVVASYPATHSSVFIEVRGPQQFIANKGCQGGLKNIRQIKGFKGFWRPVPLNTVATKAQMAATYICTRNAYGYRIRLFGDQYDSVTYQFASGFCNW